VILYTFHMCDAEGFSTSFETRELASDMSTIAVAIELLAEHLSADHASVWDGDRHVLNHYRTGPVAA